MLPDTIKDKFTVSSPAKVTAAKGIESIYIEFDVTCNSSLEEIINNKIESVKKENESSIKEGFKKLDESFSLSVISSVSSEKDIAKKMFLMKKGDKETISLYITPRWDSDKNKLIDYVKQIETTNSLPISSYKYSVRLWWKNFDDEGQWKGISLED